MKNCKFSMKPRCYAVSMHWNINAAFEWNDVGFY